MRKPVDVAENKLINREYELVPESQLKIHPLNPRRGDVFLIRALIRRNGFHGALLVQRSTGLVLIGNHRLMAARAEGIDRIPVIWADVDDDRATRILLSDNRSSDVGGYDSAILKDILGRFEDLSGTGYADRDLEALIRSNTPPDDFPSYDADIETKHRCPKCGYEWS